MAIPWLDLDNKHRLIGVFLHCRFAGLFVLNSGTRGAEFEGRAQVVRGEAWGDCGGCCGDSDEMEDKLLLIKGTYCFVFFDDEDKAPKVRQVKYLKG